VQLLRLMDKDKNGKVSGAEFMKFMNDEFNRLDYQQGWRTAALKLNVQSFVVI
jgi:hypothetical protein